MSGPGQPEPAIATARTLKRKDFSQDDQGDLDSLDQVFKRIKTAVPHAPYILSTPSLHPYTYHSRQESFAWMLGHLWRQDEESLQYRTYVYREPCQDCLELQAGEDDDQPDRHESRTSSSGAQVAKKKLNLSAFKVKQANGTITPGSKKVSPTLPPTKVIPEQVNGVKKAEKHVASDQKPAARSPKRYVDSLAENTAALKCDRASNDARDERTSSKPSHDGPDPAKRPRPRSPSHKRGTSDTKISIDKSSRSNGTPHGLPPLLSPVQEPSSNPYGLPDILSPTLPSNIQAELDKLETQRKRAESNASTSSSDRKSQTLAVPEVRTQKAIETVKAEPRIRSVPVNGKSPNIEPPKRKEDVDPSLVVKLKFSKAKAPTVTQLLRLPPKRTNVEKKERHDVKDSLSSSQKQVVEEPLKKKKPIPKVAARRSDNTTPVSTPSAKPATVPTPAPRIPEKRPRTDDDTATAVPSKRPRAASSQDRPSTPTQQAISSPSISNKSSAQKAQSQFTTPKNNHKTVSMLRTHSTESNESTPGRSVATPAGIKVENKRGPTSAPLDSKKQADIALLNQTSMKLNQMGRALKHEATKILTATGKPPTKQEEKRAAVTNMECIL
jgi:hypothetical protein